MQQPNSNVLQRIVRRQGDHISKLEKDCAALTHLLLQQKNSHQDTRRLLIEFQTSLHNCNAPARGSKTNIKGLQKLQQQVASTKRFIRKQQAEMVQLLKSSSEQMRRLTVEKCQEWRRVRKREIQLQMQQKSPDLILMQQQINSLKQYIKQLQNEIVRVRTASKSYHNSRR